MSAPDWLDRPDRTMTVASAFAVLGLALLVRLPFFVGTDFPLADGGLFSVMARAIAAARWALPLRVPYNGFEIPFVYPPLALYLLAIAARIFSTDVETALRFFPLAVNLFTIAAFARLASRVLGDRRMAWVATLVYVVSPNSYQWLITGGGATRGVGLCFTLLALAEVFGATRQNGWRAARIAVFTALAALSHIEAPIHVVAATFVQWTVRDRSISNFRELCAAFLAAVILTSPWWVTVLLRHGVAPFIAASGTTFFRGALFIVIERVETTPTILFLIGLLGIAFVWRRREWTLVVWLAVILISSPRSSNRLLAVPWSMLSALGIVECLVPLLEAVTRPVWSPRSVFHRTIATCLVLLVVSDLLALMTRKRPLWAVPKGSRDVMRAIASELPHDARFVVVTGNPLWALDGLVEWFPVLAERASADTPQGAEWLPDREFDSRRFTHWKLQNEGVASLAAFERWRRWVAAALTPVKPARFTHVYIDHEGPWADVLRQLDDEMSRSPRYALVLDRPAARVFALRQISSRGQGS